MTPPSWEPVRTSCACIPRAGGLPPRNPRLHARFQRNPPYRFIERKVYMIPTGRETSLSTSAGGSLPGGSSRPCRAGCGTMIEVGAICAACHSKRVATKRDRDTLRGLEESTPRRFRWAHFGADEIVRRVRPARAIEEALALDHNGSAVILGETGPRTTSPAPPH